ncbi:TonB-dependent receptor [Thalassotalea euphylliae]|uniref:TonB-dependent receptor n=1 Tax=Thalassotalea euphylliae TaxID=1655234 RepID=UPI00362CAD91
MFTLHTRRSALAMAIFASFSLTSEAQNIEHSDNTSHKSDTDTFLETITVTAQKRTQNLQEVPIAVTTFSGQQLQEAIIKDVYDLQTLVPAFNAFQHQSATQSFFSIRGVGTSSQNFGLESSVGLYVDGVYRARQNSMINNFVDIEAVEVLKGPQGTLFGKNTPSGAVTVRTVKPSHESDDGFLEVTAGNYGLLNFSGAKSFSAIEDVLAFRATAFSSDRDGIVDNIILGDETQNDRNRWGARLQMLYTPSSDISLRVIADHSEIDEICCGSPALISNFTAREIPGKFGTDALLTQPPFNGTFISGEDFFERKVNDTFLPESTMKDSGISVELDWDVDERYRVTSITGFRNFDSYDHIDTDYSDVALFGTINDVEQSSFSQELRLTYSGKDLTYIVGLYYFTQDLDLDYSQYTDGLFNEFYMAGFEGALDPLLSGIDQISALTGGLVAPSAQAAPAGVGFDHISKQDHESYAIFGQFDYRLSEKMTLTAGLRYTDEKKEISTNYFENMPNGTTFVPFFNSVGDPANPETIVPGSLIYGAAVAGAVADGIATGQIDITTPDGQAALQAFVPFQTPGWGFQPLGPVTSQRSNVDETLKDDKVTGTAKLSYQLDPNAMVYASIGTGYKSGGTNTDRLAEGFDPIFDAETSTSYEVGIKKDFIDHKLRINAAAHYTEVEDFQANAYTGNGFNLQNAGDYKIDGVEVEVTWLPTDEMEVHFAYARVNAEFDNFERGNCWVAYTWHTGITDPGQESTDPANPNPYCNRSGDRPAGEPEDFAALSIKQELVFLESIYSFFQIDYSYTGDMVLDSSNDPYAQQDSYSLVNARLFAHLQDYDLDIILWGRNVFDEEYVNGNNFNVPIQDGKMNAYVSEPRTFGVTLRKQF